MTATAHSWSGYSGPAPLAPWSAHAVPLDGWDVGMVIGAMRERYLHLSDPSRWDDDSTREIAAHMAAGVLLCLKDLESACHRSASAVV